MFWLLAALACVSPPEAATDTSRSQTPSGTTSTSSTTATTSTCEWRVFYPGDFRTDAESTPCPGDASTSGYLDLEIGRCRTADGTEYDYIDISSFAWYGTHYYDGDTGEKVATHALTDTSLGWCWLGSELPSCTAFHVYGCPPDFGTGTTAP